MKKSLVENKSKLNIDEVSELFCEETLNSFEMSALIGGTDGDKSDCSYSGGCTVKNLLCDIKIFCGTDPKKDSTCGVQPVKVSSCTVAKDSTCG